MRLKTILYSLAALTLTAATTSCSSQEDAVMPEKPGIDFGDAQKVTLEVQMPSTELKTRSGEDPALTYGSDGLYLFPRDIDHLWYAVYYKGTLKYNSFEPGVPQAYYDSSTRTFKLDIQLAKINGTVTLSDYSVFFFAGNAADKVTQSEISDGIGLDFANKTVYAYPSYLNRSNASGDMFTPAQYDFFCKYTTMDRVVNNQYTGNVTLIRPFCQVSLLTDALTKPMVLSAYDSNRKVSANATPGVKVQMGSSISETLPYAWNYGTDQIITKPIASMPMTIYSRAFDNSSNTYTIPQEVTFRNRKMFCAGSYLMLAPENKKNYMASSTSEVFNFTLSLSGNVGSDTELIGVNIPAGGIKANEKYVLYNKNMGSGGDGPNPDPDPDPTPGPDTPFTNHYVLDVVIDANWGGGSQIEYN